MLLLDLKVVSNLEIEPETLTHIKEA